MRRWLALLAGALALFWSQTLLVPSLMPPEGRPDLWLITVALVGFTLGGTGPGVRDAGWDGRVFIVGALFGGVQGWLHGTALWSFVLSRTLAAGFAYWLRAHWLWGSALSAAFCVLASVLVGELCQGFLLCLAERHWAPLASHGLVIGVEALTGALLGGLFCWWRQGREVAV